jgi:glycosyltransferase involved in cell wall biosynthesis
MLHFIYTPYLFQKRSYQQYESANHEIVKYARRYFETVTPVHMTHFNSSRVTNRPEDILLGHPTWDSAYNIVDRVHAVTNDWVRDNALSPDAPCHPNTYIYMPWMPFFASETHMPFAESQLAAARLIFANCGSFWYDQTMQLPEDTIQGRVKSKLVRVDMGCAGHLFPYKTKFKNGPRRNLLHVSNLGPAKNMALMVKSIEGLGLNLFVASGSLDQAGIVEANVKNQNGTTEMHTFHSLGPISNNDAKINAFIVETMDFYLHTSRYDAQATAIIENCARGLVPLVTPESGFACPHAIMLTQDAEQNREIINRAAHMSESEYAERSIGVREHVLKFHNWDRIYERIWKTIQEDLNGTS